MRAGGLGPAIEGMRVARSQLVVSALVALISATVVVAALQAASQSVAAQRQVREDLERSGSRTLTVFDDSGDADISAGAVSRIAALSTVAWAVGFGPVADVTAFEGGTPVAASPVVGTSPDLVLHPGSHRQGLLGSRDSLAALGLTAPAGQVFEAGGTPRAVVGSFSAAGELSGISNRVLAIDDGWQGPLRTIVVQADSTEAVTALGAEVRSVLGASEGSRVRVEVPEALAKARERLNTTLAGSGRLSVIGALAVGLLLTASTILAGVLARRRDFGRRRALGASRSQLVVVIVSHTLTAAVPAVLLAAVGTTPVLGPERTDWSFTAGVSILALLAAAGAATVPGVVVARLDPLKVLRVP